MSAKTGMSCFYLASLIVLSCDCALAELFLFKVCSASRFFLCCTIPAITASSSCLQSLHLVLAVVGAGQILLLDLGSVFFNSFVRCILLFQ